jgi:DNA invertase Pin-like site-specific DNA recombinase
MTQTCKPKFSTVRSTVEQDFDAKLRNALRKRNYELPGVSNDMQSSETLRNSLGLNYKLDRPGRSLQHLAQLIGELERHGTALLVSSQGHPDPGS